MATTASRDTTLCLKKRSICCKSELSMMLYSTRMALAWYRSLFEFMSFIRELVTIMISSAEGQISLMTRYTIRRRLASWFWNSFVTAKKTSVASFFVNVSPWHSRYRSLVITCWHRRGFSCGSWNTRASCRTAPFSIP